MNINEKKVSRRKVAGWLGFLSLFTILGGAYKVWGFKKPTTVKMLTRDGKLVEVDTSLLAASRKKITNNELQNWVQKK